MSDVPLNHASPHEPPVGEQQPTTRWRLDISYDGTDFSGWATQPGLRTCQGELEHWIPQVMRLKQATPLTVAGRTDAGVHARGQVAHVDLPTGCEVERLHRRLSRVLEADLRVHTITPAPPGFDARFSAIWRRYVYRIWDDDSDPDPLMRGHIVQVRGHVDVERANHAAQMMLGLHDFAPFCRPRSGATTIRTLTGLQARRSDDGVIEFTVTADAFCHSMVRSLMGAVTTVARGRQDEAWLATVMGWPRRHNDVLVMPAKGLCLEEVGYPDDSQLALRAQLSRAMRSTDELEPVLPATPPAERTAP